MSDTIDANGIEIKAGHNGVDAGPFGGNVWLLRRYDDKLFGAWATRHEAIGARATELNNGKEEWYEPIQVKSGTVRMSDVVFI